MLKHNRTRIYLTKRQPWAEKQVMMKGQKVIIASYYSSTSNAHKRAEITYRIYALSTIKAVMRKHLVIRILEITFVNGCSKSKTIVMAHNFQGYSPIPTQEWFGTRGDYAWGKDLNTQRSGVKYKVCLLAMFPTDETSKLSKNIRFKRTFQRLFPAPFQYRI